MYLYNVFFRTVALLGYAIFQSLFAALFFRTFSGLLQGLKTNTGWLGPKISARWQLCNLNPKNNLKPIRFESTRTKCPERIEYKSDNSEHYS